MNHQMACLKSDVSLIVSNEDETLLIINNPSILLESLSKHSMRGPTPAKQTHKMK